MYSVATSVRTMKSARSRITVGSAPSFRSSDRAEKRKEVSTFSVLSPDSTLWLTDWHLVYSITWNWRKNIELWRKRKANLKQGKGYAMIDPNKLMLLPSDFYLHLIYPICRKIKKLHSSSSGRTWWWRRSQYRASTMKLLHLRLNSRRYSIV